jgi:hypothetical protein
LVWISGSGEPAAGRGEYFTLYLGKDKFVGVAGQKDTKVNTSDFTLKKHDSESLETRVAGCAKIMIQSNVLVHYFESSYYILGTFTSGDNGMKSVPTDKPSVQAYLRHDLKQLLVEDAHKNDRSVSSEVTDILERYMDRNHYLVRVPDKIREQLEEIAQSENRNIENMIEWIIIQFINQRD